MVTSRFLYLALVGAVALQRLLELRASNRNVRKALARGAREHGRRHYPAMVALHVLFLPSCAAEVLAAPRRFRPALGWTALGGLAAAQLLRYWAIATLGERWTTRILVHPSDAPVTTGPYRFVRHPNYVAVALEMALLPLVHSAYWTAAVFSAANAVLLSVRIRAEERAWGAPYARAFAERPRFFPHPLES